VAPTHNTYVFKDSTVCLPSITTLACVTPPLAPRKIALWRVGALCGVLQQTPEAEREIIRIQYSTVLYSTVLHALSRNGTVKHALVYKCITIMR